MSFKLLIAQENKKNISISFNDTTVEDCITQIENTSNFIFYFNKDWLNSEKRITANYQNKSLNFILNEVLKNTVLNFYIQDGNKVILTKNVRILEPKITIPSDNNITGNDSPKDSSDDKNLINGYIINQYPDDNYTNIGKVSSNPKKTYTLKGYIINAKTNAPAVGAVVINRKNNSVATSNTKGYYTIDLPFGKNDIEIVLSGFETSTLKLNLLNNATKTFSIDESSNELDEVVINAKAQKNIKSTVTGVTSLKAESIKLIPQILGERDLLKASMTLPGIKNTNEGSQGFNVRGGKSDQNLFLLDNTTLYNPSHFLGIFSAINPFLTQGIDVFKGNIPSKYGGRVSSVFDIKLKDSNFSKFKGEASVGPVTGNIAIETPIIKEKSGLMVGVRSTYSDWLLDLIDNEKINKSEISFYDASAKYTHKINEKNTLKLMGYYSNDKYRIATDSINSYQNRLVSLDWKYVMDSKNNVEFKLSNSSYDFETEFDGNEDKKFLLKYDLNEYNFKVIAEKKLPNSHKLNYGLDAKLYVINPGDLRPNGSASTVTPTSVATEKGMENSLFISDNFNVSEKLALDFGIRYTNYSSLGPSTQRIYADNLPKNESNLVETKTFGNNEIIDSEHAFSGYFSSRYNLSDDLSVKFSINNSNQFIHRLSNNISASPIDIWKLSDLNIKPISALQYSLGFYKNFNFKSNLYKLSVESYYKTFDNLLDYRTGADLILNPALETEVLQGEGKAYGVEFLLSKEQGALNGWISYTYSRSLLKFASQFNQNVINNQEYFPANFDKPHDLNLVLNYKFTKRYSFSANFSYQTGRPITYPIGKYDFAGSEFLLYSDRNKFRLPDYYRLDLGINIEGNHRTKKAIHSFWNISIYNVLGRNNVNAIFFTSQDGQVNGFKTSIFAIPIPTITYNLKF